MFHRTLVFVYFICSLKKHCGVSGNPKKNQTVYWTGSRVDGTLDHPPTPPGHDESTEALPLNLHRLFTIFIVGFQSSSPFLDLRKLALQSRAKDVMCSISLKWLFNGIRFFVCAHQLWRTPPNKMRLSFQHSWNKIAFTISDKYCNKIVNIINLFREKRLNTRLFPGN